MNSAIMDVYKSAKAITALLEDKDKERRTVFHRVGFHLKCKKHVMHGYAYWPTIKEDKKGNVVGMMRDRAYQIVDGTFYKCAIDRKNNIFIPFESGDVKEQNKFHTMTRKQRREAEKRRRKQDRVMYGTAR